MIVQDIPDWKRINRFQSWIHITEGHDSQPGHRAPLLFSSGKRKDFLKDALFRLRPRQIHQPDPLRRIAAFPALRSIPQLR
jgi:hypothetical protein